MYRFLMIMPLICLASCDPIISTEFLGDIQQTFVDCNEDYVALHDMFIEDELTRLELYYDTHWEINGYYRNTYTSRKSDIPEPPDASDAPGPYELWFYYGDDLPDNAMVPRQEPIPFADVLSGVGITEERLLRYDELMDSLGIKLITKEGDDLIFYIRSFEFGSDYVIEIVRTSEAVAGTIVSTVADMKAYGDEDYYLLLDDGWYLHYRNYISGNIDPRPRHPNGPLPLSR